MLAMALALLSLAFDGGATAGEHHPTEPAYLYRAEVVRVVDGDTIDVDIDLGFYIWIKKQRIRMLDIDAPEMRGESKVAGAAATEYLKTLIDGKEIILRTSKGKDGADRDDSFGRWLGTVYLDGVDVNQQMIRAGHAVPYEDR
ncbi:MAG: thermonuclease family protein [Bauldia litoralis]